MMDGSPGSPGIAGAAPFKYIIDSVWSVQWAEPCRASLGPEVLGPLSGLQLALPRTPAWRLLASPWDPQLSDWVWMELQLPGLAEDPRELSLVPYCWKSACLWKLLQSQTQSPGERNWSFRTPGTIGAVRAPASPTIS